MEEHKSKTISLKTVDGPIQGYIDERDEGTYYKFKSIPYAKPPIGPLRFMPPCPIPKWFEEIDCTKDAPTPICFTIQSGAEGFPKSEITFGGSEDCLYIEVSTPNIKSDKPQPVMFWIGSIGFTISLDTLYDPTLINDQNIVFVKCGFRLGPIGFLSIQEFTAPGNCGLKDVVMALKWVQRNISNFGGDPNNVTIFGGPLVHFMMLSPMATGLFHKAILQSATALNSWSLMKNPSNRVFELAKVLGITTTNEIEIVEELRYLPGPVIMEGCKKLRTEHLATNKTDPVDALFKPCIEQDLEGQPAFLTKSPPLILKSGNFNKVPIIIGSNNIEGDFLKFLVCDFLNDFEKYNKNVNLLVPSSLAKNSLSAKDIGQQLLQFYLGGETLNEKTLHQYLQFISDYYFLYYVNKTVRLHSLFAPECPIYYYIMNYAGEWSVPKEYDFFNSVGHTAEVSLIFRIKIPGAPVCKGSRDSVKTRNRVVKMWTNFAQYGNPTPDADDPLLQITWDPVENENKLHYLNIGAELTKGRNPFQDRINFWEELHKQHKFLQVLVYFNERGVLL